MIAAPAGFTARATAWPRGASVFARVHLPPAGRLAGSVAPPPPGPPHEPGSWTGGAHEPAACAGSATAALAPIAISKAGSAKAPRRMNRDMTESSLQVARLYGLMVIVTVPLAMLPCESCTCMGKL